MFTKQQIGVIYAGGYVESFSSNRAFSEWSDDFVEIKMLADIKNMLVYRKAHELPIRYVERIISHIKQNWDKLHGIVVTIPYDDFLFIADSIAFMLGDVGKPVVFTTVFPYQLEEYTQRSDYDQFAQLGFRAQVVNAVQAALGDYAGSVMVIGPSVLPITHVEYQSVDHVAEAKDAVQYGRVDFGVRLNTQALPYDAKKKLHLRFGIDNSLVRVFQADHNSLSIAKNAAISGAIVYEKELSALSKQFAVKKPLLQISGAVDPVLLIGKKRIVLSHLTPSSASAKFAWIIAQLKQKRVAVKNRPAELLAWMQKEEIHEFLPHTR